MKECWIDKRRKQKNRRKRIVSRQYPPSVTKASLKSKDEFEKNDGGAGKIIGVVLLFFSIGTLGEGGTRMDQMELIWPCVFALLGIAFIGTSCKNKMAQLSGVLSFGIIVISILGFLALFFIVFVRQGIITLV